MRVALAVGAAVLALSAGTSAAAWRNAELDRVASVFAMRSVGVKCATEEEDARLTYAWGYVLRPVGKQRFAHIQMELCAAAANVNSAEVPAWQRALGVKVLVHESYHLRRWGGAPDEAKVECQAIRHWKVAARLLGATEETVTLLWPYALGLYFEQAEYLDIFTGVRTYYDVNCVEPSLVPEDR